MLYILAVYTILSLLTFAAYAVDKRRSRRGGWRVRESTLHLLALCGGVPGAIVAEQVLRHKNRKLSFRLVTLAILLVHLGGWALYFLLRRERGA